jgi:hypothetical protein
MNKMWSLYHEAYILVSYSDESVCYVSKCLLKQYVLILAPLPPDECDLIWK